MFFIQALANTQRIVAKRCIFTTPQLFMQPPKKKRRIEPALMRVRVERKMKKIEREISHIEAEPRFPIPIIEYNYTAAEMRDLKQRPSHSNLQEQEKLAKSLKAAQKLWSMYRCEQSILQRRSLKQVEDAQINALNILKQTNKNLYDATTQVDDLTLIPFSPNYIRKDTAPNPDYIPPDGMIKDITKEYVR